MNVQIQGAPEQSIDFGANRYRHEIVVPVSLYCGNVRDEDRAKA